MTLALACGRPDVEEFEEELSARNMTRWEQWFARRPQGQYQSDQMIALLAASLLQAKGANVKPPQFMVNYQIPDERQTLEEEWQIARSHLPKKARKPLPVKTEEHASAERPGNPTDCGRDPIYVGNL